MMVKRIITYCIRLYQLISRTLGAQPIFYAYSGCRSWPTCSEYAIEAVEERGAVQGILAASVRVMKCNGFSK